VVISVKFLAEPVLSIMRFFAFGSE